MKRQDRREKPSRVGLPNSGRFFQGGHRDFRQLQLLSTGSPNPGSIAMEPSMSTEVDEEPKERKKIQFVVPTSTEVDEEPKERKKIQFAVPTSAPTNLDPRQVEMVSWWSPDYCLCDLNVIPPAYHHVTHRKIYSVPHSALKKPFCCIKTPKKVSHAEAINPDDIDFSLLLSEVKASPLT